MHASNIDKDVALIIQNAEGFDVENCDESLYYGEGWQCKGFPKAEEVLNEAALFSAQMKIKFIDFQDLATSTMRNVINQPTGYTGEDGFEVIR